MRLHLLAVPVTPDVRSRVRRVGLAAFAAVVVFGLGGGGCTDGGGTAERIAAAPLTVVATTGMVGDLVRCIGGNHVRVTDLMGEGVDPHLYKPTRDDAQRLVGADLIFYSGLMLEGRMADTFARVSRSGKPVYAVTEKLDEKYLLEPPGMAGHWDPHVWMDVAAWSKASEVVEEALCERDATNAAMYRKNGAAYREELKKLDDYARRVITSIPKEQRVLVTAHDAFNYFSRAYGIEVRGVQGISTESEPGVQDINRLVDFLVARKVGAIFVETSVSDKNMQALLEGARSRGHTVQVGGALFSDAMGAAGRYEGTYIGMIDHNATVVARALGGTAPETGLNGKLALARH